MYWDPDAFVCIYCGKKFQNTPVKLALHIRNEHESARGKLKNLQRAQTKTIKKL